MKMEFQKEWTKEELDINKLKIQIEGLTERVNYLEKCYIDWTKIKKYYSIEEISK